MLNKTYGKPVDVESETGVVASQKGWSLFDARSGNALLRVMAFDGQLVLVDTKNRVRWSLGVRGMDVGHGVRWEYVRRCALDARAGLAAGGTTPVSGYASLLCEVSAGPEARATNWVTVSLIDVLTAAATDREWLNATASAADPGLPASAYLQWSPVAPRAGMPSDAFEAVAEPVAAASAPTAPPASDFPTF